MWLEEFKALMSGTTITPDQIDRAMTLKDLHLPARIYKFRAFTDCALKNLRTDTVWLCSPDKYNDPYECSAKITLLELLPAAFKRNLDKILNNDDLKLSDDEKSRIRGATDQMRELAYVLGGRDKNFPPDKIEEFLKVVSGAMENMNSDMATEFNTKMQTGMKVCSFSARKDSVVMWGHYAACHTGFCVEYDIGSLPARDIRRRLLHPVIYSRDLFDSTIYAQQAMSGGGFNNLFGIMAAIQKSDDWRYEDEWRFALPMGDTFPDRDYDMPTPSAIYIGARAKDQDRSELTEFARAKRIPIFNSRLSTTEFKMTFDAVS